MISSLLSLHLVLVILVGYSFSCSISNVTVLSRSSPAGIPRANRFNESDLLEFMHINEMVVKSIGDTPLYCVDAREDEHIFGAPGGDAGEFLIALQSFYSLTGQPITLQSVSSLFNSFVDTYMNSTRYFYFHTDTARLRSVFEQISSLVGRTVVNLPYTTPTSVSERDMWLDYLSRAEAQGCGHIRLQISNPSAYGYTNETLVRFFIQSFYTKWWSLTGAEKQKLHLEVKAGALDGLAVTVVSVQRPTSCAGRAPRIQAAARGASSFMYHPENVADFRSRYLVPFFTARNSNLNGTVFLSAMESLANTQLGATLGANGLAVANQVNIFSVRVTMVETTTVNFGLRISVGMVTVLVALLGSLLLL